MATGGSGLSTAPLKSQLNPDTPPGPLWHELPIKIVVLREQSRCFAHAEGMHGGIDDIFEGSAPSMDLPQEKWLLLHVPGVGHCSDSLAFFGDVLPWLLVGNGGLFLEEHAPAVHSGTVPPAIPARVSSAVNKTMSTRADCAMLFLGTEMSLQ